MLSRYLHLHIQPGADPRNLPLKPQTMPLSCIQVLRTFLPCLRAARTPHREAQALLASRKASALFDRNSWLVTITMGAIRGPACPMGKQPAAIKDDAVRKPLGFATRDVAPCPIPSTQLACSISGKKTSLFGPRPK